MHSDKKLISVKFKRLFHDYFHICFFSSVARSFWFKIATPIIENRHSKIPQNRQSPHFWKKSALLCHIVFFYCIFIQEIFYPKNRHGGGGDKSPLLATLFFFTRNRNYLMEVTQPFKSKYIFNTQKRKRFSQNRLTRAFFPK